MGALSPSRGVFAVWRRHFRVWKKTFKASLVGNFGEPFLYLMGMGFGLGRFIGDIGEISFLVYVASGILAASSMNTASFEVVYGGFTRMTRQQTFHAMLATPLRVPDVVAGEVLWAASKSLMAGMAILLVGFFMGAFPAETAVLALPVVFLSGILFGSLGMVVTAISPSYEFFLYYFTLGTTPMFLFCGVFYPVATLPGWLQEVVWFLPLTHVIALVRPLTTGLPLVDPLVHLAAMGVYIVIAYAAAVVLVRRRIVT